MTSQKQYLYKTISDFNQENPSFPFTDIKEFCKTKNINLIPYTQDTKEIYEISKDGFCFFENGKYSIFYNKEKPITRTRFTIAHELGHIYLGHYNTCVPQILKYKSTYQLLEGQANTFAQNILLPAIYAKNLEHWGTDILAKQFTLSRQMVQVRYKKLPEDIYWLEKIKNF